MANLVWQLPVSTNNPLLRRVSRGDIRPVGAPDIERDVSGFWQFNQGEDSFVDMNHDKKLIPLGSYDLLSNLLAVRTSPANALLSDIADSLEITFAVTLRAQALYSVGKNTNICGNINMNSSTAEAAGIGLRVQRLSRNLALAYRNQTTHEIYQLVAEMPADLLSRQVLYVGGGRSLTHAYLYIGGVGYFQHELQGPVQASAVRNICLGNGWSSQDSETAGPFSYVGEWMVDRTAWNQARFDAAYVRARERASDAGLSIY